MFAATAICALLLAACGSSDKTSTAISTTSVAVTSPTSTAKVVPSESAGNPAAKTASDPRCAPASAELTSLVSSGLSTSGYGLTNGTVITDGPLTFYGATTVDAAGKTKNRSDVWVINGNVAYASTGGARNGGSWSKASDAPLKISAGDERVQAVDKCVVNITTG